MSVQEQNAIKWFKTNFGAAISAACQNTPYSLDMATAIAMQETYSDCWGLLYQTKPVAEVLRLCVGDTLDFPKRGARAFPKNKAELLQAQGGQQMFDVARTALLDIAQFNRQYATAAQNPDKFCHAFGIFQYDIQHFKQGGDAAAFFLNESWNDIGECIKRLIGELNDALKAAYGPHKTTLNDDEMMYVAIAYNAGHVRVGGGPKQGFQDGDGVFYGEGFQRYLALAHATSVDLEVAADHGTVPPVIVQPGQTDLGVLLGQIMALMQILSPQRPQPTPASAPPAANQTDQAIKALIAVLDTLNKPNGLGPVNGALGQTVGNLLDGKKSAIGIIGAVQTAILQVVGPSAQNIPLIGSSADLGKLAMPVFLATAAWGVLGKLEKWLPPAAK
jgi:hypothetical protein